MNLISLSLSLSLSLSRSLVNIIYKYLLIPHFRKPFIGLNPRGVREISSTKQPHICPYLHTEYLYREHHSPSLFHTLATHAVNHSRTYDSQKKLPITCTAITTAPPFRIADSGKFTVHQNANIIERLAAIVVRSRLRHHRKNESSHSNSFR